MTRAGVYCAIAYVVALATAAGVGAALGGAHPIVIAAAADAAGTVVVFGFSRAFDNSSLYDPYWSVAPPVIGLYWALGAEEANVARQAVVLSLVLLWGVRLTYNWVRRWEGLGHEDWRYVDLRNKHGRLYWLVSFAGVHFFPTVLVFLGCLPLFPALTSAAPLSWLDGLGAAITVGAIAVETIADRQLHDFLQKRAEGELLASGVWRYSLYPNYFGEVLFWWGLFAFGVAAAPAWVWAIAGALAITLLFRFISIPMMEERKRARRPGYAEHAARTSVLVPRPPRRP